MKLVVLYNVISMYIIGVVLDNFHYRDVRGPPQAGYVANVPQAAVGPPPGSGANAPSPGYGIKAAYCNRKPRFICPGKKQLRDGKGSLCPFYGKFAYVTSAFMLIV